MACVAFCAAIGAHPARFSQSDAGSRLPSHPGTFLIFPFENGSHMANLDWLGEGLADLTGGRLEDRGLNVLSRQERLAALEKIGLPDSARFSHATMVKIAEEADADEVVFGSFVSDGKTVTMEARVLRTNPPQLSPPLQQTGFMQDLLRIHAHLSWQILCAAAQSNCLPDSANKDESSFSEPPPSVRLDAVQDFIQGLTGIDDEARIRSLREAARLEPAWDRPAFELGQIYFERRDCEMALPWLSRVPPNRPDGPESSFSTGVCHLIRNDPARAEAAFSGLLERARSGDAKDRLPELPEARNNLGIAHLRSSRWSDAAADFDRAAALDPDEADYWFNLGLAKLAEKQPAAALNPFERARKLSPDDKDVNMLLASTLDSLGRSAEAATIRSSAPDNAGHASQPVSQDPVALARLARVITELDRSVLRTDANASAAPVSHNQSPRRSGSNGAGQ